MNTCGQVAARIIDETVMVGVAAVITSSWPKEFGMTKERLPVRKTIEILHLRWVLGVTALFTML